MSVASGLPSLRCVALGWAERLQSTHACMIVEIRTKTNSRIETFVAPLTPAHTETASSRHVRAACECVRIVRPRGASMPFYRISYLQYNRASREITMGCMQLHGHDGVHDRPSLMIAIALWRRERPQTIACADMVCLKYYNERAPPVGSHGCVMPSHLLP